MIWRGLGGRPRGAQEIEQKAGMVIPYVLSIFVPFRWAIGALARPAAAPSGRWRGGGEKQQVRYEGRITSQGKTGANHIRR